MIGKAGSILVLLGIAGGAYAYWKYREMNDDEKAQLKSRMKQTGSKIKDAATEVEATFADTFQILKRKVKEDLNNI